MIKFIKIFVIVLLFSCNSKKPLDVLEINDINQCVEIISEKENNNNNNKIITLTDKLNDSISISDAIEIAKPYFTDAFNIKDQAVVDFVKWTYKTNSLTFKDINAFIKQKHTTKISLVKKDPDSERGKTICLYGKIVEIRKISNNIYFGILIGKKNYYYDNNLLISFWSIGDTGDLLENSKANFCGIVSGLYSYKNSGGGISHAVNVIGFFDLKTNCSYRY